MPGTHATIYFSNNNFKQFPGKKCPGVCSRTTFADKNNIFKVFG
jgi:hypothetical protein